MSAPFDPTWFCPAEAAAETAAPSPSPSTPGAAASLEEAKSAFLAGGYGRVLALCAGVGEAGWRGLAEGERGVATSIAVQSLHELGRKAEAKTLMEKLHGGVCGMGPEPLLMYLQLLVSMGDVAAAAEAGRAHLSVNKKSATAATLAILRHHVVHVLPAHESWEAARKYLEACYVCFLAAGADDVAALRAVVDAGCKRRSERPPVERTVVTAPQPAAAADAAAEEAAAAAEETAAAAAQKAASESSRSASPVTRAAASPPAGPLSLWDQVFSGSVCECFFFVLFFFRFLLVWCIILYRCPHTGHQSCRSDPPCRVAALAAASVAVTPADDQAVGGHQRLACQRCADVSSSLFDGLRARELAE